MIERLEVRLWSRRQWLRWHCRCAAGVVAEWLEWDEHDGRRGCMHVLWGAGEGSG